MNVNTLKLTDPDYPNSLKYIAQPPAQLFWTGQDPQSWLNKPKVAVVGSRKFTAYGKSVTEKIVTDLSAAGVVIISGLAFGIDVTAHTAALAANGITVAVLATGLDNITPRSHHQIARQIMYNGTIFTERPAGSSVHLSHFVIRNRLISALADIVLIPEAVLKSGSLHTARFALEQGKTVMAVPGNITSPASEGCNNLIKSGAIPVTSSDDVFFALKIQPTAQRQSSFRGSKLETAVYDLIRGGVTDQDNLIMATKIDGPTLSSTLTMLEIGGYIRPAGAGNWVIS
jgi:DNA processing protein